jgi:hypothetical protein
MMAWAEVGPAMTAASMSAIIASAKFLFFLRSVLLTSTPSSRLLDPHHGKLLGHSALACGSECPA